MNLSELLDLTSETEYFSKIFGGIDSSRIDLGLNIFEPAVVCALSTIWKNSNAPILILTSTPKKSSEIYHQLNTWLGSKSPIYRFPEVDEIPFERHSVDVISTQNRLEVLSSFRQRVSKLINPIIVSSIQAVSHLTLDRSVFDNSIMTLKVGDKVNVNDLSKKWLEMGYQIEKMVDIPGTFARRGGILDLFTITGKKPIRIELYGDNIESIRLFDPDSQKSFKSIKSFTIPPAEEILPALVSTDKVYEKLNLIKTKQINENHRVISNELAKAISGENPGNISFYSGFFLFGSIFDYLSSDSITILISPDQIKESSLSFDNRYNEIRKSKEERGIIPPNFPQSHIEWDYLSDILESRAKKISINFWGINSDTKNATADLPFEILPIKYSSPNDSVENIQKLINKNNKVVAISNHSKRLVQVFSENLISNISDIEGDNLAKNLSIIRGHIPTGFRVRTSSDIVTIFSDNELFGVSKEIRSLKSRPKKKRILFEDLKPDTYVVHVEHGIAVFRGTKVMKEEGKEFLVLEYADEDKLFVPTEHLDRVQIYHGAGDILPKLTRLGTQEWIRVRARAKRATEQIAGELIALYAKREATQGVSFDLDTPWQESLESSFPFYETEDQLVTINSVKEDMESSRPMDRLICGDVGFGKTEIALRAAFKAVQSGKQVSILVPTTVLAQQHLETFLDRLKVFPINIDVLSRFTTKVQQKKIINKCKNGEIDIVIGTHRILQGDVQFKDLGLLIIDEEHKFGVEHKEKLKQIKTNIDILTLSATPIPRTLNMSLSGIRDLSTIETPPEQRLPIKTYVSENNDLLIRDAILREYDRGGQVYFVYNRIKGIDYFTKKLSELVPEVKIKFAHGRMEDQKLEQIMFEFGSNKFDVLVCTTIIESGIDNPNVNTIIVDRADRFGLSQLYQLRGRIGRGLSRAFAYLLIPKNASITESAEKRLNTILSATELGSGFYIAMRDLEIRGIGNILGSEQSGQISAVGFELYSKLLNYAVENIKDSDENLDKKNLANKSEFSTVRIDLGIDARIPDSYIQDLSLRLGIYQRLASINSLGKLHEIIQEIKDRFGPYPKNVELLGTITKIRIIADNSGIERITADDSLVTIVLVDPVGDARTALNNFLGEGITVGNKHIKIIIDREDFTWLDVLSKKIQLIQDFRDKTIKAIQTGVII